MFQPRKLTSNGGNSLSRWGRQDSKVTPSDPLSVGRNYESDGAALIIKLCYMAEGLYTGLMKVDFEII